MDEQGMLIHKATPKPPLFLEPVQSCGIGGSTPLSGLQTGSSCWAFADLLNEDRLGAWTRQCLHQVFVTACCFFCRSLHFTFGKSLGGGLLSRIWDLELPDTCCPVSVSVVSSCCFSVHGWKEENEWTHSDFSSFCVLRWTHFKWMLEPFYNQLIDQPLICWEDLFLIKKKSGSYFLVIVYFYFSVEILNLLRTTFKGIIRQA